MKNSRYSDSQILAILKQAEAGTPVPALCREHGMSSASFYKWRAKFGGMDASMMNRMKELEDENRRLKESMQGSASRRRWSRRRWQKVVKPSRRCEMAQHAVADRGLSIHMACAAFSISETCYRYQPRLSDENAEIADRLIRLTHN
jgi:putative transposase